MALRILPASLATLLCLAGSPLILATPGAASAAVHYDSIAPFSVDVYPAVLAIRVRMVIDGNDNTNLDCVVHALDGRLLAVDRNPTDSCVLIWDQRHEGPVSVEVTNLDPMSNLYTIDWE